MADIPSRDSGKFNSLFEKPNSLVAAAEEPPSHDSDNGVSQKTVVRTEIPDYEKFRVIHVLAYILAAVMGREYSGWTSTLKYGFGMFGVAQLLTAAACIGYYLCMSEIWSAIPFSGGSYGLSRASLGFYVGFLDGCCEALVYVAHSAISAMGLSQKVVLLFRLEPHYQLVFCVVFYAIAVWITAQKCLLTLRRTYIILAVVSTVILFVYIFGAFKYVNFIENAPLHNSSNIAAADNWFIGGINEFMFILSNALTPYAGVKSFALLTINTKDPKKTLPKGVVIGFCVIFAINMMVIFTFVSMPGGILKTASLAQPMMVGNALMFQLSPLDTFKLTMWLSLPAAFAKLLTYILPGGNLFHCLGNSYYLPPFLCINKTKDRTNGCIVCAVFGLALCVLSYYNPEINLYNVCVMATMITDCTFIYSYVQLRTTYSTVERSFVSPWGLTGAVYTFVFFSLVGISAAFFQNTWFNVKFAAAFFGILTVYYFTIAKSGDQLCEEEDKVFLQLHVRNYNRSKKSKLKRGKMVQVKRNNQNKVYVDSSQGSDASSVSNTNAPSKDSTAARNNGGVSIKSIRKASDICFDELEELQMLQNDSSPSQKRQSEMLLEEGAESDAKEGKEKEGLKLYTGDVPRHGTSPALAEDSTVATVSASVQKEGPLVEMVQLLSPPNEMMLLEHHLNCKMFVHSVNVAAVL